MTETAAPVITGEMIGTAASIISGMYSSDDPGEIQVARAVVQALYPLIRRQVAERPDLAAVREYRIYVDEDGDGIRMHGPCADTIGCLFGRLFNAYTRMHEDVSLGQVIDAALEHERDKEQLHAAQERLKQDPEGDESESATDG